MKIAQRVFLAAGIFGLLVIPPLYFLEGAIERYAPPAIAHPEFYYGFVGVTLAWQLAYLLVASDPVRYRPLMLLGMLAKGSFVAQMAVLVALGRVPALQGAGAVADLVFVVLFGWAYVATGRERDVPQR